VDQVLDAFLSAPTWDETHAVLMQEQDLLLGDRAIGRLQEAVDAARHNGDIPRADALARQLALLQAARAEGIPTAWERFLAEEQQQQTDAQRQVPIVVTWLNSSPARQARHFLREHPELLQAETDRVLDALTRQYASQMDAVQRLRLHAELVVDARARGGTIEAIDSAYVNALGGLALDVPPWLEEIERQAESANAADQVGLWRAAASRVTQEATLAPEIAAAIASQLWEALYFAPGADVPAAQDEGIALLEHALTVFQREHYPLQWAGLQSNLGSSVSDRQRGDHAENLEAAIGYFTAALEVYTQATMPLPWALTQNNLGNVYRARIRGDHAENQERALASFTAALEVYTREALPDQWANTQNNLGVLLVDRARGDHAENVEQAIAHYEAALEVYTAESHPASWAMVQNNLGIAYKNRVRGEPAEDLERAIAYYTAALTVRTREALPADWAATQNNLGRVLVDRIRGDHEANLDQAIACYRAALEVRTREAAPMQWALTTRNLGEAYQDRTRGGKAENLAAAIACYEAALAVYTHDAFPGEWAATQNSLGNAYADAGTATDAGERIERAIACYMAALEIHTPDTFPREWAGTRSNLGNAYRQRRQGDAAANLEQAIACYTDTLRIRTREALPLDWAATQSNLGNAYVDRIAGKRAENLEQAIACYRAALEVYTETSVPTEWARVRVSLGAAYSERVRGERAENLEEALACTESALRVYTRAAYPADWASTEHNLGKVLLDRVRGERAENIERALEAYTSALDVFGRAEYPVPWAMAQIGLGNAYLHRLTGGRAENLERAIACFTAATEVYTAVAFPMDWAMVQNNLGNAYSSRVRGERAENLEQAIACYEAALSMRTQASHPLDWAATSLNLGSVYSDRIREDHGENLERSIACYEDALKVFTREALPIQWAMVQNNLGSAYSSRVRGEHGENLERAIACYAGTLEIYTREALPLDWARMQNNLGNAFYGRQRGERAENLERAAAFLQAAEEVYTRAGFPLDWALAETNLGRVFSGQVLGDRAANLELALAHLSGALEVYGELEAPIERARVQHLMGTVYVEQAKLSPAARDDLLGRSVASYESALTVRTREAHPADYRQTMLLLAEARADQGEWAAAQEAYARAREAEALLLALSAGARGQDAVLRDSRDAGTREAYTLARLGRLDAALLAVERGRARALAATRALAAADPARIGDASRRQRYAAARERLIEAQTELNRPLPADMADDDRRAAELAGAAGFRAAQEAFDGVVAEIRAAGDPADFLERDLDQATLWQAARQEPAGHALVYLLATPWGGTALAAVTGNGAGAGDRMLALDLPELTYAFVMDLLQMELDDRSGRVVGGFGHAQEGRGFSFLSHGWPGATFAEKAAHLHSACEAAGQVSMLDEAAREILRYPAIAALAERPLGNDEYLQIDPTLAHAYLQHELRRCLPRLGTTALGPLARWLQEAGATSLTLIPCGGLAAFPLGAVPLDVGSLDAAAGSATHNDGADDPAAWQTLEDALPVAVAPSARALLHTDELAWARGGVATLGDPRPTHQELLWGEAEALTVAAIAGTPSAAATHEAATRERLLTALREAAVVDACCHGEFDANDFLRSRLLLAGGESLTLGEMVSGASDLRGLRLLILSACQTAILDLRGANDEVRSLAATMLGAGAQAVLGALWSVDDKATYLLIVRFAQEWLPRRDEEPPAAALARARHWLRTATNRDLRHWEATALPPGSEPTAGDGERLTVRGGGLRYGIAEAAERITAAAAFASDDARPYSDPIFWSAFQITGW
jgi:tetratricopeptide (TPR) repeat protein